jgi:hypothetical protein
MLKAGQSLLLNNRLWSLRQVRHLAGRNLELEAMGASEAALGMTRRMKAIQYGDDLFIEQHRAGYWRANLQHDWIKGDYSPVLSCKPATQLDLLDTHTRQPALGDFKNQFTWSYSRGAKYRYCPRAYYYHYYASWEGWQTDAPAPIKRVYLLKNLSSISRWVGNVVHETIKFAMARLKAGHPMASDALIKQMHRRVQTDFEDSRSGRYQQTPNELVGFQEHYYQTKLPETAWREAWSKAEHYLRTFTQSALYADLRHQPATTFLNVEELQSFLVAGVKVWVQMDLARYAAGVIYLYDWKTGQVAPTELQQQLGIYGLYARYAWPEWTTVPIRGIVYALAEDRLLELELDDTALQTTQAAIKASISRLQGLLVEPQANLAELRRFPMIDDLSICQRCQFRELCGRER